MTTSAAPFLAPILSGDPIPIETLVYFRTRFRLRLQEFILHEFARCQRQAEKAGHKFTRRDLAHRINRKPELVTRWLGSAGNMTADTISDLLLGIGAETDLTAAYLSDVMATEQAADLLPSALSEPSTTQAPDLGAVTSLLKYKQQRERRPGLAGPFDAIEGGQSNPMAGIG